MNYIVKIIEYATSEVVKEIPCDNERLADRVERGLNINLNHNRFFTQVVRAAASIGPTEPTQKEDACDPLEKLTQENERLGLYDDISAPASKEQAP